MVWPLDGLENLVFSAKVNSFVKYVYFFLLTKAIALCRNLSPKAPIVRIVVSLLSSNIKYLSRYVVYAAESDLLFVSLKMQPQQQIFTTKEPYQQLRTCFTTEFHFYFFHWKLSEESYAFLEALAHYLLHFYWSLYWR